MKHAWIWGVALLVCARSVRADVIVETQYASDGTTIVYGPVSHDLAQFTGAVQVQAASVRSIVLRGSPTTLSMPRITVTDKPEAVGTEVRLYIANLPDGTADIDDFDYFLDSSKRACSNWAGIDDRRDATSTLHLKATISGNLTGSIIGTDASSQERGFSRLNTLEVSQQVQAKVRARDGFRRSRFPSMRGTFPELPKWVFEVTEVSAGVYQVSGCDHLGRSVEAKGTDPCALIEEAKRTAARMMNDVPSRQSGSRVFESR